MRLLITALATGLAFALSSGLAAQDAGLSKDNRTFKADGSIACGQIGCSYTADLVVYRAGNQVMMMEELIRHFQAKNQDVETVYVETVPSGQILKGQILKQGQIDGQDRARNPDLYASINLGHLKRLKAEGLMDVRMA